MCGIVGLFDLTGSRPLNEDILRRMNRSQRHRGPDGEGEYVAPGVGLGHRRLSIIDLEGGRQPLWNEDGHVAVVFNGEIYNFADLARELMALGHRFSSRSDTEVLVHGWEAWGEGMVSRLRGMFAFAIYDRRKATLFLARDRLGIKPLHYGVLRDGWLAFASELKGITSHPNWIRHEDPRAVESFFALGYVPDPLTMDLEIRKLPPGHQILLEAGRRRVEPQRYWDLDFESRSRLSLHEARGELMERLRESVQAHMVADVDLASFLSGGVDSSAVSALMAQASGVPVTACTVAFDHPGFDETPWARRVARQYGMVHHVEQATSDHFHLLDRLAWHHDEPFADHSSLPTWIVCEMARQRVKVVLSGDGGDEAMAGYERYGFVMAEERVKRILPVGLRRAVFGPLGWLYPKGDRLPRMFRAKSTLQSLAMDSVDGYFHAVSMTPWSIRRRMYSREFFNRLQGWRGEEVFRELAPFSPQDPLSRMQYLDFKTFLAGRVLTKVDRASMAHGLEVRVPILDHELVTWMATLPPEYKLFRGHGKYLLKEALQDLLPRELLYRPKMGFIAPVAQWLRGPLAQRLQQTIHSTHLKESGCFDLAFLERMTQNHLRGKMDCSGPLWAVLQFEAHLRNVHLSPASPGEALPSE